LRKGSTIIIGDPSRNDNLSYDQFVIGYANTVYVDISFDSVVPPDDNTVNVDITIHATEQDGKETFRAHYVVAKVGDNWKFASGHAEKIG
jgi:hypothetical protein